MAAETTMIEQGAQVAGAGPTPADLLEAEQLHEAARQIDEAIREIQASGQISSSIKDELISNLRSLRQGLGPTTNLALIRNEVTAALTTLSTRSSEANSEIGLQYALTAEAAARVSARVAAQFAAIEDGDIVVIGRHLRSPIYDDLPPSMKASIDAGTEAQLSSEHGQRLIAAAQQAQREDPEGFKHALEKVESRKEFLQEQLKTERDASKRALIEQMLASNAYAMPAADRFVELIQHGASFEECNSAARHADRQLRTSMVGAISTARQYNARQINDIIAAAPEAQRQALMHDDATLASYLIERSNGISDAERHAATRALERSHGDTTKLSAREREIINITTVMPTLTATSAISGALMQMGRDIQLERAQQNGQVLTASQQAHLDNYHFIADSSHNLMERAQRLVDSTTTGRPNSENSPLFRSLNKDNSSNLALSTLTLAYTDQHGGIVKFQEYAQRMEFAKTNGARDAEAERYFSDYQNYFSSTLINEPLNPNDASQSARLAMAMQAAGQRLADGSLQAYSGANGVRFSDSHAQTYALSNSVFNSASQVYTAASGGASSILRQLYLESRQEGADPEFVSIVRDMDTYRLASDPHSSQLIKDVWLGARPLPEIRAQLDAKIAEERAGMQEFAANALAGASAYQRQLLQSQHLTNADGSINVAALMDKIESNKVAVYDVYQAHLGDSLESLRISPDPQLRQLAEARALSELVSPMRSAHSLEHLTNNAEEIEREVQRAAAANEPLSPLLVQDQKLLAAIIPYNPATATPEETAAFRSAVRNFLMRDAYTAEKEAADQTKPPGERANLVDRTTALIEARLREEPEHFQHLDAQSALGATQPQIPASQPPAGSEAPVPSGSTQETLTAEQRTALASEGSRGGWDGIFQNTIEDRIKKAIKGMDMAGIVASFMDENGRDMLGSENVGSKTNITYNEIENALAARGLVKIEQIDTNGDKQLTIEEIRAALSTPIAGGQSATVVSATTTAPAAVPTVQPQNGPAAAPTAGR